MKLERPLVIIDTETTGVDPVLDRIVEFGMVLLSPNGDRKEAVVRFNPSIPIPAAATEKHGITDEMVKDCPLFFDLAPRIAKGLAGRDIAGYNLRRLDLPILDEELRRAGLRLDLAGTNIIDIFGIYSEKKPRKLEDCIREYCGRDHVGAHGALADAVGTLDALLGQLAVYPDLDTLSLPDLAAFSQMSEVEYVDLAGKLYRDKDGDVCFAFGKNKDAKVKAQRGFANWMLSKDFPGNTKDAIEAELERVIKKETV